MHPFLRFVFPLAVASLVACGSEAPETNTSPDSGEDALTDTSADASADTAEAAVADGGGYEATYVPVGAGLTVGKSRFSLRISRNGSPATGLSSKIAISPLMAMEKMSHGNPVPPDAVKESETPGLYDVTTFFTMASVDSSGKPAGQWTLNVSIGAEPKIGLPVTVSPATGTDATHAILRNAADTFTAMGSPKMRSWVMFRDRLEKDGTGQRFGVFLATVQEGMLVWPPVTAGLKLLDASGKVQLTVEALSLSASVDGATWAPMTCDANARCAATLSSVPATGAKILVKLQVNGKDYTTDGAASDPAKSNGFATFAVTPS